MHRPRLSARTHSQRGLTLTEVAIVMTVIAFILAGIWATSNAVDENARVDLALKQMRMVVQNTRDMYGANHNFQTGTKILNSMLINANAVPADMLDGADILSPWETEIFIRSTSTTRLQYEWQGLSEDTCRALAGRLGGKSRDESLIEINLDDGATLINGNALDDVTPINVPECNQLSVTFNLR